MSGMTQPLENQVLDLLFGAQAYVPPGTWYVGLYTAMPNDDGTGGTECSGGGYARVAVTNNLANWPAASGGTKANANTIQFPTATLGWGTVVGFGLFTASSGGTPQLADELTTPRPVLAGDDPRFLAGELVLD
jgi:hypothetical protein